MYFWQYGAEREQDRKLQMHPSQQRHTGTGEPVSVGELVWSQSCLLSFCSNLSTSHPGALLLIQWYRRLNVIMCKCEKIYIWAAFSIVACPTTELYSTTKQMTIFVMMSRYGLASMTYTQNVLVCRTQWKTVWIYWTIGLLLQGTVT